jgi:ring-1,2-phenylacetyl-CoA epoxidase subunit PaaC
MEKNESLFRYLLRLGDTSLIQSHRLSEWTGHGPFLEEDLALTNIALDVLGRAKSLLEYAGKIEGKGRSEDALAYLRNEREYFNTLITELPNGDYAKTILRQAFIDTFDLLLYSALTASKDETLRGIAEKSVKEIRYHKRHSHSWVVRFGNGTEESRQRLEKALDDLWEYTGELFEMNETDQELIASGIAVDLNKLKAEWTREISELFNSAELRKPDTGYMHTGSRQGIHTEHLGFILAEMQTLPRMYPTAKW